MSTTACVVGAGVLGRLLALRLRELDWAVTLLDRDDEQGTHNCSWTGAGMLSPYCEREAAERLITDMGIYAMDRWPAILQSLSAPVFYREAGSLVVAHPNDRIELDRLRRRVLERAVRPDQMREVRGEELAVLEPELGGRFNTGLYFPLERHVDNRALQRALLATLRERGATCRHGVDVRDLRPHRVTTGDGSATFDWVFDCRGLGAASDFPDLRGVRGELLYLHAPDVNLQRPVRMMHPRYSIYIVPRADHTYVVGATMIESDDMGPMTVRSALELLSAAYSVHPGFAEGRLLEASVNCRPGFPDNHPRIVVEPGLIRINGLFRHGFLVSPALVDFAAQYLTEGTLHDLAKPIWRNAA
jgi:glycine oxidase